MKYLLVWGWPSRAFYAFNNFLCQVVVMESGKVLEMGNPVELAAHPGGKFEQMLCAAPRPAGQML